MSGMRLAASYRSVDDYLEAYEAEIAHGGLLVRGGSGAAQGSACTVVVRVGSDEFEVEATVMAVARSGVAVSFDEVPEELTLLAERLREIPEPLEPVEAPTPSHGGAAPSRAPEPIASGGTVTQRLATLSVAQRMAAALSADRETRIALLRDNTKAVHVYVLKNPRIQLDEVQYAAKMTTLSPDAIDWISKHAEWGANPTICAAIVRNPKSPLPAALRLLPRLAPGDLRAIAKGGARDQLVQAARRLTQR